MIEIRGIEQLAALAAVLETAERDLRRDLERAGDRTAREVTVAAQESARRVLPTRGGVGRRVAAAKFVTRRRGTGDGVKVVATSADSLRLIDRQGVIRHPVFGNPDVWVTQKVPASWWTRPTEVVGRRVGERELVKAMDAVAGRINRA